MFYLKLPGCGALLLQSHRTASTSYGVGGANQIINRLLRSVRNDAHTISDIFCRLARIPECTRDLDVHILNLDASFERLQPDVVGRKSGSGKHGCGDGVARVFGSTRAGATNVSPSVEVPGSGDFGSS